MNYSVQTIIVAIVLCIPLAFAGYAAVICRLRGCDVRKIGEVNLQLSVTRLVYLISVLLCCAALAALFSLKYHVGLLAQMQYLCVVLVLFPCAAVDFKTNLIPNSFLLSGLVCWVILKTAELIPSDYRGRILLNAVLASAGIGLFFLLLFFIFKNSIGMGDIKLFALMGLYLGVSGTISAVFFSLLMSFFVAVYYLLTKKKSRKDTFSFGPCILAGTVLSLALGGM